MDHVEAASSLVKKLNLPPQYHSIYVRTETTAAGDFNRSICVSWNPNFTTPPSLPKDYMGFPVVVVDWPKGL